MPDAITRNDLTKAADRLDMGAQLALRTTAKDLRTIHKFGKNEDVGTSEEDIWAVGGDETLLTSAATMYASSEDNTNGVGQVIKVEGLDSNWALQEGRVTLTGQTQAPITLDDGSAATWTRIHRAYQISAAPDPVGDVWIAETDTLTLGVPDTATKVHGFIDYTDAAQQTEKAILTVPAGYVALIYGIQAYMDSPTSGAARFCNVGLEVAPLADGATVASPSWSPRRRIMEVVVSTVTTDVEHMLLWPLLADELTNIHLRGKASAASNISASFEVILVPKV